MNKLLKLVAAVVAVVFCEVNAFRVYSHKGYFTVHNCTGHNVYLVSALEPDYAHPVRTMLLKDQKSTIKVPNDFGAKDQVDVFAFYTDGSGVCYRDHMSYTYDFVQPNGLILYTGPFNRAYTTAAMPLQPLLASAGAKNPCDKWYKRYVDQKARFMPHGAP